MTAFLAVSLATSARAQSCPGTSYSGGYFPQPVSSSSGAVSGTIPAPGVATQYILSWDHVTGSVSASCSGGGCFTETGGYNGSASVLSMDDFVLVGPASAALPITIRATAHVALGTGQMQVPGPYGPIDVCVTGQEARVRLSTDTESTELVVLQSSCPGQSANQVLTIAKAVVPGVPFRVSLQSIGNTGCTASANASATLSFANVPYGYTIQSCSGFAGLVTTSASTTSWGRLKSIYR